MTPAAWRQSGRVHVHRGQEFFYREHAREPGASPALLLIHGFPTSSWDWHKLWPGLAAKFPRFFKNSYEPIFFDKSLSLSEKVLRWRTQPMVSLQLLTNVVMLSLLAVAVMTVG